MAQKKRERAQAQAAEAKELQKFYLVKAMAAPFAGQEMAAPTVKVFRLFLGHSYFVFFVINFQAALQKAATKAAKEVRPT